MLTKRQKSTFNIKKEIEEIKANENLEEKEKERTFRSHYAWVYGSLLVMKREKVAGEYKGKINRFRKRDKRDRVAESPTVDSQHPRKTNRQK